MKYLIFLLLGLFIHIEVFAQRTHDSTSLSASVYMGSTSPQVIEIKKVNRKSRKKIHLKEGRNVWVHIEETNGDRPLKKVRITHIQDHQITFKLANGNEVMYPDSILTFIGFTSTGRIILATTLNTVIIGTAIASSVVVIGIVVIQAVLFPFILLSRNNSILFEDYSFKWVEDAFHDIGDLIKLSLPFKKKINLTDQKWKLQTVMLPSYAGSNNKIAPR